MNWKIIIATCIMVLTVLTYTGTYFNFGSSFEYSHMNNFTIKQIYSKHLVEKCSKEFLLKVLLKNNVSYTEGSWVNDTWKPSKCEFSNGKSFLPKCLPDLKIRKMLILGDSNGRRWGYAALRLLQKEYKCNVVKKEIDGNSDPTEEYFKEVKDTKFHKRDCITCTSFLYQCVTKQPINSHYTTEVSHNASGVSHNATVQAFTHKLDIEYLAMEYYMDNEMITQRRSTQCKNANKYPFNSSKYGSYCGESMTTQQFIFNEYLYTQPNYPTLIVIIGNHHEPERRVYSDLKRDLTWFLELLQQVVHNDTRVYWIESTYVSKKWNRKHEKYEEYNRWALQVISKYYKSNPSLFYPFYGIFDLSKNKTEWYKDGMHYNEKLYTAFMELFFKTLCE
ncbi:unnamed protein product [Owenia fusiformis]|uniref:Uncharacterized protein n=1 Tax=Owenia fusiformis TaxID=6347 RepID=A0A8J1TFZ7_OWEFU|nr:unnamed protein product [Owenia fusiformis]